MNAEIITIGDEILIGQIVDTNSQWIAKELNKIGISVYQITSIQDDTKHITKAIAEAQENAEIVIITGGLGPTKDDITKHTITTYFQDSLVLNEEVETHIKNLFAKINYPFTEVNRQQALVPTKSEVLFNELGTAPGMWLENEKGIVVSMPGVPNEMKGIVSKELLPKLQYKFDLPFIYHKTILTYGMGESMVADRLETWEDALPKHIKLAYLPQYGKLMLRLTAKGDNEQFLIDSVAEEVEKMQQIIGDIIVGYDENETMEALVGKLLTENKATLAIAESCTGGKIAETITSVPGSSAYFIGGIVPYNVKIKIQELEVLQETVDKYTVVSEEVAKEMALGIQKKFGTDYAIATTGNAGPTKDLTDETVGTVYISIASPAGICVEKFNFGQPREKVIHRTTLKSLELLQKEIRKNILNSL
ncbi:competence/damage-inducible protein A [Aureivirga sp. CE67]|uniref:competence/damage-inducible protein A n=1 Tax=Aureivirga sp. CE67 TaxID=1788983 RepID=UPI0018CA760F|nr:competence/damage-inducible protein A [Aureivirga sp. CE67]